MLASHSSGNDTPVGLALMETEEPKPDGWLDRIEELSAALFFGGMLITVLAGIFWRFVLESPLVWTVNISTLCFMWAVLLGSPLSDRRDNHLQFDLLYKVVPPRVQLAFRLFGNALLVGAFVFILPSTLEYLLSVGGRTVTGVPWLNFTWAYRVFLVFLVLTIASRGRLLFADIHMLASRPRREK